MSQISRRVDAAQPAVLPEFLKGCPPICFDHLHALTGPFGLYEHAEHRRPRTAHGYTTDDNARALVITARAGRWDLIDPYESFVLAARTPLGFHNRMSPKGIWMDLVGSDDCVGRAMWGLAHSSELKPRHIEVVVSAAESFSSDHPRAMAYAVIGLSHLVINHRLGESAIPALTRLASRLPRAVLGSWAWPYPKLTYDNGRIPQALINSGNALGWSGLIDDGLELLSWLLAEETDGDRLSFTPHRGRSQGDPRPGFDQQPLEAWAISDACLAASHIDGPGWLEGVKDAASWLIGHNDLERSLYDPEVGATHDGLTAAGVNENCGAESTLSGLGVLINWYEIAQRLGHSRDD